MKYLIYIILIPTFYSCSKLDGKIETRGKGKVYLVNASTTNTFKFTVKITSITNDSIYNYQTQIIELAPGDEVLLGNKYEKTETKYPTKEVEIFKPLNDPLNILKPPLPGIFLSDTILDGKKVKYYTAIEKAIDSLHPYPVTHYEFKYEVKGQLEVRFKQQDSKDKIQ